MLKVDLDPLQTQVFQEVKPGTVVVLAMGRGTGKTFLGIVILIALAFKYPGIHIGLLLPSLKQARAVFWPHLIEFFTGALKGRVKFNRTELTAEFENGSRLTTWGAENAHSIRGQRFGAVIEDECDDIDPAIETAVVQPTFSRSGRDAIWVKSGTPRRGRSGILFRDFELGRKKHGTGALRYRSFRFKSSESKQVDQKWLESIRAITDPAMFAREYDCDFDSGEGLVYCFDEQFHVRPAPPMDSFSEFLVGADHGDVDPGVMLLIGIQGHGNDARCYVIDEWHESEQLNSVWDERLKAWDFATVYADPSRKDRLRDWRNQGRKIRDLPAEVKPISAGIARVAEMLHRRTHEQYDDWARLYIDPKCVNTIREFGLYRRKKHIDGSFSETPEDKNNHCLDSLRYAIAGRFGRVPSHRTTVSGS